MAMRRCFLTGGPLRNVVPMSPRSTPPLPHPFPVVLDLRGVPVLVVGGGRIAARKTRSLLDAGAAVTAVAPSFDDSFPSETERRSRAYRSADLLGIRFVVTATGVPEVDAAVATEATAAGIWVNAADDPQHCSVLLPAVERHGSVTIAVSTGGASPALARWIRDQIAEVIGPEVGVAASALAAIRAETHERGDSTEDIDWHPIIAAALHEARSKVEGDGG